MFLKFNISRILHNKIKLFMIGFLILLPFLSIGQALYDVVINQLPVFNPNYVTILAGYRGHIFVSIMIWFMPLYILTITGEDGIEDYETGYGNILKSKVGKKEYYIKKLLGSFLIAFTVIFLAFILNILVLQIIFYGGTETPLDPNDSPENLLYTIANQYPLIANFIFALVTSFSVGLISMVGTSLSIVLHNRKIVYAITFALWFIPITMKSSLALVFQPFSEYDFNDILPIFLTVSIVHILVIAVVTFRGVKFEKI